MLKESHSVYAYLTGESTVNVCVLRSVLKVVRIGFLYVYLNYLSDSAVFYEVSHCVVRLEEGGVGNFVELCGRVFLCLEDHIKLSLVECCGLFGVYVNACLKAFYSIVCLVAAHGGAETYKVYSAIFKHFVKGTVNLKCFVLICFVFFKTVFRNTRSRYEIYSVIGLKEIPYLVAVSAVNSNL